ncbi:MAG: hypothetical protein KDA21_01025, partial [Phycisphaerales bacterium]|nr:hypothetical protein [Phycisphaerales bacterium]
YSFTLLDHPPYSQVAVGNVLSWPDEGGGHRALTYAISDQLLPGESPEIRAAAVQAILDSLNTWSWGTCGYLTFTDAGYSPVENHDSTPKVQFEGPSIEEWIAMGQPLEMPFGWGANVDIFSKPRGYTMISNGVEYRMRQGILGFTAIHRNGNRIESVDIYLNENFDWTTIIPEDPEDEPDPGSPSWPTYSPGGRPFGSLGGGAPSAAAAPPPGGFTDATNGPSSKKKRGPARFSCAGGFCWADTAADSEDASAESPAFDVATFVVHELGHALGLDHPDQAASVGGAFVDPWTQEELPPAQGDDPDFVMFSYYTGVKRDITADEVGGLAFLYPNPVQGDLNVDGVITIADALIAIELWQNGGGSPWQVRTLDFVIPNGEIDLDEVAWVMLESLGN